MSKPSDPRPAPVRPALAEVRYSLPAMLEEIKAERVTSSIAMERIDQDEIGKLFKARSPRRAKSKK